MENKNVSKKMIIISIIACIICILVGFVGGFITKTSLDKAELIAKKEKQLSLQKIISKDELQNLKNTIKKDEEDYGENYQKLIDAFPYRYTKEPTKIYFKHSKIGGFYVFEKDDMNFSHILEVAEDRMSYSVMDDYNLNRFTPVSVDKMLTSNENYIIFDYNEEDNCEDIICSFSENTRLYRLITYLSYDKRTLLKADLPKKEFTRNTSISGYQYMSRLNSQD